VLTSVPVSRRFVSQRLPLHYLDWGNPEAPLLILVHGGQDHAHNWDWVADVLRQDWHVICPDLRGHGDSAWSSDGSYSMPFFVADLAQLVHQCADEPATIVAHSLGGAISLRYAGIYPDRVRKLVIIEGLGISALDRHPVVPVAERWRDWIETRRALSSRAPRRYLRLEDAFDRMREANPHLSIERMRHLTVHGISRNEDGTYSWKFDNYSRVGLPAALSDEDLRQLWHNIACPVWLVHGADSWAMHPAKAGSIEHFQNAMVTSYQQAGHWVHHDRFDDFMTDLGAFLAS
jgi:pimeloyl-ACP methyl ester carboxylesterase